MASSQYNYSSILSEVKALKEFEIDTPVNRDVLGHIDKLLSLNEEKTSNLEAVVDSRYFI